MSPISMASDAIRGPVMQARSRKRGPMMEDDCKVGGISVNYEMKLEHGKFSRFFLG
jgi:hypothetical protein